MESIIKRLFKGDVYPEEDVLPQSGNLRKQKVSGIGCWISWKKRSRRSRMSF